MQTCKDFRAVVFEDEVGIGVGQTHQWLRDFEPEADYVWVFDDDNLLTDPRFIETLKELAKEKPDIILCEILYGGNVRPKPWPPRDGNRIHGDVMCFVVTKELWNRTRHRFGLHYAGDADWYFWMLEQENPKIVVYPGRIGRTMKVSHGSKEHYKSGEGPQ